MNLFFLDDFGDDFEGRLKIDEVANRVFRQKFLATSQLSFSSCRLSPWLPQEIGCRGTTVLASALLLGFSLDEVYLDAKK